LSTGSQGPDVNGVVTDSRTVSPGNLFVALPGDPGPRFHPSQRSAVDGHDYVADARARGASAALVHRLLDTDLPQLLVNDTYDGLWALGRAARQRLTGAVVAITGSSGKTTAKHFLAHGLDGYMPPGSFNNHIGVPLALANADTAAQTAVFEVGTSFPGEIEPLAQMVAPQVAIVLNVGSAHIENFPSREHLKIEKLSIFNVLEDKSNAISHENLTLGFGHTFGHGPDADAQLVRLDGDMAEIKLFGLPLKAKVPSGGTHRAETMLACVLAAKLLGGDLTGMLNLGAEAIPEGRGSRITVGTVTLLNDAYNANPQSMRAAISTFLGASAGEAKPLVAEGSQPPKGRRIVVLGEMLELGQAGEDAHRDIAELAHTADAAYLVGAGFEAIAKQLGLPWFEEASQTCLEAVIDRLEPHDWVLVKGVSVRRSAACRVRKQSRYTLVFHV